LYVLHTKYKVFGVAMNLVRAQIDALLGCHFVTPHVGELRLGMGFIIIMLPIKP
jgi:hypothetical protein